MEKIKTVLLYIFVLICIGIYFYFSIISPIISGISKDGFFAFAVKIGFGFFLFILAVSMAHSK